MFYELLRMIIGMVFKMNIFFVKTVETLLERDLSRDTNLLEMICYSGVSHCQPLSLYIQVMNHLVTMNEWIPSCVLDGSEILVCVLFTDT